jgi:hypothetical protein
MSTSSPSTLQEAIQQSGEAWLLGWFAPREEAMDYIRQTLAMVGQRAKERLGKNAPEITEAALLEEYRRNPQRLRGFLQVLGGSRTPDMLLMAWRILQGMEVKDVQISYRRQEIFSMTVILESPDGEEDAPYSSENIQDFTLFRHIGISTIGGRPVFEGFYGLRVRGKGFGTSINSQS